MKWTTSENCTANATATGLTSIDGILNKLFAEVLINSDVTSLQDYLKQLKQKMTIFADIDRDILNNFEDEREFEIKSEDL